VWYFKQVDNNDDLKRMLTTTTSSVLTALRCRHMSCWRRRSSMRVAKRPLSSSSRLFSRRKVSGQRSLQQQRQMSSSNPARYFSQFFLLGCLPSWTDTSSAYPNPAPEWWLDMRTHLPLSRAPLLCCRSGLRYVSLSLFPESSVVLVDPVIP
jgi:hypothetical protein